jgi:microcystin-dependent protein
MDEFIGVIKMFAGTYAPQGWLFCQGQELLVSQYTTLYSILGNQYGGNTQRFNLPNLSGHIPMGAGNPQIGGLPTNLQAGQTYGVAAQKLTVENLPHVNVVAQVNNLKGKASGTVKGNATAMVAIPCNSSGGSQANPINNYVGVIGTGTDPVAGFNEKSNGIMKPFAATVDIDLPVSLPLSLTDKVSATFSFGGPIPAAVSNIQPSLVLNYIICIEGIYPIKP